MDWFVDAVGVPATFGSGTGKDPTKRKRKGVSTAAIRGAARRSWNNPKQKKMMLAGEGKSGSVCLSRSSLWSAGRPNNTNPILRTFREIGCVFSLTVTMERPPPQRRPASPHRPPRRRCRQVKMAMASYRRKR